MLKIHSDLTKKLEACTITTGIILANGERIGAMADVDNFAAFNVDVADASKAYNRSNPHKPKLAGKGDLWEIRKFKGSDMDKNVGKSIKGIGIAELKRRYELGQDLWGGEQLPEGAQSDPGLKDGEYVATVGDDE